LFELYTKKHGIAYFRINHFSNSLTITGGNTNITACINIYVT